MERKRPASVAASTTWALAGSTAIDRMLPAGMEATGVSATSCTAGPQVNPPSLDFTTEPPCSSKASPVPM